MKFRTQTLLFLFLFALAPLLLLVFINMPLVLGRVQDLYHGAYLQNLRADFRDLDQHIASRQEMLRLLAKLPEPGTFLDTGAHDVEEIDDARANYVEWTNRILDDQLDVIRVVFTNAKGHNRFWLERDASSLILRPTLATPPTLPKEFFDAALSIQPGAILVSPIRVDREADPFHLLTLNIASPIVLQPGDPPSGIVYITVDVGGMARAYAQTLWVHDDGTYLQPPDRTGIGTNAFTDFPGLAEKFAAKRLALWESADGRRMIWVPLFHTENGSLLWVGRPVDTSPLASFQQALVLRGLIVVAVVVLVIWMLASWFAGRAAQIGQQLTDGIRRMLEDEPVTFQWRETQELRELGDNLSKLAKIHARNTRNLRAHARELEESNRYKSEFLANVSHELRTPLNSILLLSKMLAAKDQLDTQERQQAEVIHKAGQDLKDLIDNILDLSRIEAGETGIDLEDVRLPQLLEDLLELVRPQFDAKGLYLKFVVTDDAPREVLSDANKIRQIVKNFLSNAVKFTEQGGVTLALSANAEHPAAAVWPARIEVTDTGIGIPETKQTIIFEAFKQADGSTNRKYGGTGLGLSISRRLAHMLGGEIELTSTPGQGASFALMMPLQCEPAEPPPETPETAAAEADDDLVVPQANLSGAVVLVVERKLSPLLHITPLLESWNVRVIAAADLDEALEVLAEEPDCRTVLLDFDIPDQEACDTIQALYDHLHEEGAIIVMGTNCERAARFERIADQIADCITHPVDPDRLLKTLEKRLAAPKD